jgi:undecaprenyl-diphosphatase
VPLLRGLSRRGGGLAMLSWNTALFLSINAASRPNVIWQHLAEAIANAPVLLAPVLLSCLWVWGPPARRAALIATGVGVLAGQGINLLLGLAWFEPRPFMAGIGHTWLDHVADNGFPSDHATLAWSLGLGLAVTGGSRRWGAVACLVGLATGWARVYLGIHFPLDVLASIPVGLLAAGFAAILLPLTRRWVVPLAEHAYDVVLRHVPHWMRVAAGVTARRSPH